MADNHSLRVLLRACEQTIEAARADGAWYGDSVRHLERLQERLQAELDGAESAGADGSPTG